MTQHFLDDTGLSTLWNKIKAWAAPKSHSHVIGDITSLTNALASRALTHHTHNFGEIEDTDSTSLSEKFADIAEDLSDKADDADVVHRSGDETIGGTKIFSGSLSVRSIGSDTDVINFNNTKLEHIQDPVASADAANKSYVDNSLGGYKIQVVTALPSSPNARTIYFVR